MTEHAVTLRRCVAELKGHRGTYGVAIVVALGETVAMLAFPLLQRAFYDRVLIGGRTDILAPVLLSMLGVVVLMVGSKALASYLFTVVAEDVKLEVRDRLAAQAFAQSPSATQDDTTGELVSVATNDIGAMSDLYRSIIGYGVVNVLWLAGTLLILAVIDVRLLLVAAPLLALYALLPVVVTPGLRRAGQAVQRRTAALVSVLQESFAGVRDIRAFGRIHWGVARQRESGEALRDAHLRRTRLEVASSGSSVVYWVSVVGISWYGAIAVSQGRVTVGGLLALLMYFGQLQLPVSFLVGLNSRLQLGLAGADRIFAHLDRAEELPPRLPPGVGGRQQADSATTGYAPASVEVWEVNVRYAGRGACLRHVTLQAGAGEFVAIVGETGSGKTTLLHALLGLVTLEQGEVRLDGLPLAAIGEDELRRRIAFSSADSVLFDLTVSDNIKFGNLDASDEEVRQAAWASAADEFVSVLPEGYGTIVGERGARLSTGQRQRLLLARALVRRPVVLLLDEATSGLDWPTERLVLDRLLDRRDRPTIVMVTHRLSALDRADRIYVLERGRVVEKGAHHELIEQGGVYRRLCRRQGLDQVDEPVLTDEPVLPRNGG